VTIVIPDPADDPTNSARAAEYRAQAARRAAFQKALRLSLSGRRDLLLGLKARMPSSRMIERDDLEG
jgi:hypothetical protein